MPNPNLRTVTGKSTIPAGVAQAGTFTTTGGHTDRLTYSGTAAALEAILGAGNTAQEKTNLWIHIPTSDLLLKVLSWGGQIVKVDGVATGVSAEAWELVEANLDGWSVLNQGGSAAAVGGQSLGAGNSISDTGDPQVGFMDAVIIDGSSTSLLVMEKL